MTQKAIKIPIDARPNKTRHINTSVLIRSSLSRTCNKIQIINSKAVAEVIIPINLV